MKLINAIDDASLPMPLRMLIGRVLGGVSVGKSDLVDVDLLSPGVWRLSVAQATIMTLAINPRHVEIKMYARAYPRTVEVRTLYEHAAQVIQAEILLGVRRYEKGML